MLRIMVVDDEELAAMRLMRILSERDEPSEAVLFLSSLEASEYARKHPIDVAFLDISMPDVNGMQLSKLLTDAQEAMKIVFVTGYDAYAVRAFELNALDYIMKPVTAERLEVTLKRVKAKKRTSEAVKPLLEVLLFNGMNVSFSVDGGARETVKLRSPKTEELFAFLLCKRVAYREEIIDTLWNGLAPDKAWKNLNSTLYYVRKAINGSEHRCEIAVTGNEIRINTDELYCDLYEFERMLQEIRRDPEQSMPLLKRAEALYAGPLLRGKAYEWAGDYARSLERQYIDLLELLARHNRQRGQFFQALSEYGEILKLDAIREDVHGEIIRIYLELGRKNDALRQYRQLEAMLRAELGMEPDAKIRELLQ
ncbi:BTAD domain-containing putative transcriptional regulator [Cohnella hongkongensis]|uniref:BTAD domain-containing putative transcriptional regulator n=1 Tax=Cohnella hongkongensis TaxID=178337 RepID=A0ABV9F9H0_9BACL